MPAEMTFALSIRAFLTAQLGNGAETSPPAPGAGVVNFWTLALSFRESAQALVFGRAALGTLPASSLSRLMRPAACRLPPA